MFFTIKLYLHLNCVLILNWIVWNRTIFIKIHLTLNNIKRLICHKNPRPTNQPTHFFFSDYFCSVDSCVICIVSCRCKPVFHRPFLCRPLVVVSIYWCYYLKCWQVLFLLLFLIHTVCLRHFWDIPSVFFSLALDGGLSLMSEWQLVSSDHQETCCHLDSNERASASTDAKTRKEWHNDNNLWWNLCRNFLETKFGCRNLINTWINSWVVLVIRYTRAIPKMDKERTQISRPENYKINDYA